MAYEKVPSGFTHTFRASTGLQQYQFVAITGANNRLITPTTSGTALGVLISSGTTGSTGRAGSTDSGSMQTVQFAGIAKAIAGSSTIAAGNFLKPEIDGLVKGTTGPLSTSYIAAVALEAVDSTSTSAHVVTVLLNYPGGSKWPS